MPNSISTVLHKPLLYYYCTMKKLRWNYYLSGENLTCVLVYTKKAWCFQPKLVTANKITEKWKRLTFIKEWLHKSIPKRLQIAVNTHHHYKKINVLAIIQKCSQHSAC